MGLHEFDHLGCPEDHRGSEECGQFQYIHRSLREFSETPKAQRFLLSSTEGSDCNADASQLRGYIRRLKGNIDSGRDSSHFISAASMHAHFAELGTQALNNLLRS